MKQKDEVKIRGTRFKSEHDKRAEDLVYAAKINAVSMYRVLSEKFPEIREVANSGLYEYWDYLITITSVGFAFMEIADSFKDERESASVAVAVQKALNEWDEHTFEFANYDIMCNFLDSFNFFQQERLPFNVSVGAWIWLNLKDKNKATKKLKEIANQEFYAKLLGDMIITTFHNWWKSKKGLGIV
jgi:hypothetical protein